MSRQRRRTAASALALAVIVAGLALPASAQATETVPTDAATTVVTQPSDIPGLPAEPDPAPAEPQPVPTDEPDVPGLPPEPDPVPTTQPEVPGLPPEPDPEPSTPTEPSTPAPTTPSDPGGGGSTGGGSTGGGSTGGGSTGGGSTGGGSTGGGSTGGGSTGGGSTGGGSTGGGSTGGGSGGTTGGTATTEAGSTAPRSSAPGTTLLSTSASDPAAAPTTDGQPAAEASTPAVSVFLTRDAGVDPGALTVDLARFYGVGIAYAGFQREENATAVLKAPAGTETALTVENRQDGEAFSTGSATVPAAALSSIGTYTVTTTGDRGSSATTTFALTASSAPGILVEPREASSSEAAAPRGAVWGFGPVESVSVAAFTTAGVRADLAAGDLAVRVDALGWSDLALGDAIVAEPTASVYCIVAVGSVSKRTAAVTVTYPEGDSAADAPEASQVCGIAITAAKTGLIAPTTASGSGGLSAGVGLTIGAGVLVAALIAGLVTAVVLRRRREDEDLLIGGPLPHATEE